MINSYNITLYSPDGKQIDILSKIETDNNEHILPILTEIRSKAFDLANSGKVGDYPIDLESFNDTVEEGFDDTGMGWTAKDGSRIEAKK